MPLFLAAAAAAAVAAAAQVAMAAAAAQFAAVAQVIPCSLRLVPLFFVRHFSRSGNPDGISLFSSLKFPN